MASVDYRLTEPIPISEEDRKLFDAVELNNICIVQNFGKDTLQRLCRVRRSFVSEWSSSDEELQSAVFRWRFTLNTLTPNPGHYCADPKLCPKPCLPGTYTSDI